MTNSFGNTLTSSASLNSAEARKEAYKGYIKRRAEECIAADKIELSKRAVDAGAAARTVIDKNIKKLEQELNTYLEQHIDEIVANKYELLHISELEAMSTTPGYRNGRIVAEIQRVVIFSRA